MAIVGAAGSGRRALIDLSLQDLAITQVGESSARVVVFRGTFEMLAGWLSVPPPSEREDDPLASRERWFARVVSALDARAGSDPVCVSLTTDSDGNDESAFASFVAGAPAAGRWLVLLPSPVPLRRMAALDMALTPLSADDVRLLAGRASNDDTPADGAVDRIVAASAGHAATAVVLVRQLVQAIRLGEVDRFAPATDEPLEALLTASFAQLPTLARHVVAAVALGVDARDSSPRGQRDEQPGEAQEAEEKEEGDAQTDDVQAAADAARAAGWLSDDMPERVPSAAHELVINRALGDADLRPLTRRALDLLAETDGRRGVCLAALDEPVRAAAAFVAAAAANDVGQNAGADKAARGAHWLEQAERLVPGCLDVEQRLFLCTALALRGRGQAAAAVLETSQSQQVSPSDQVRLAERRAWLLGRARDLDGAARLLQQTIDQAPPDLPAAALVLPRARLARVLVSMGRFDEAVAAAAPVLGDPAAGAVAAESLILAYAYAGDFPAARTQYARWSAGLPRARASYIAAFIEHLSGNLQVALELYRQALAQADQAGDIHTLAAIALNMGAVAAESGRYGEALATHDRAIRELGRLGSTTELGTALFNAAMLLVDVGDFSGARNMLARLRLEVCERVDGGGAGGGGAVEFVEAELALRSGADSAALDRFTAAVEAAGDNAALRLPAQLACAEILARRQQPAEAAALLDGMQVGALPVLETDQASDSRDSRDSRMTADLRLTRARVQLAAPALDVDAAQALAPILERDAADAAEQGRRPYAWRAALTAARLYHRAGRPAEAAAALIVARRQFEEIRMATPIDHHAGIEQDRDARFLAELARLGGGGDSGQADARAARAARSEDRLRRLLRINKRLNSELRLPRLLELIMDTVIELTEAERGFILLEDEKGELVVKVARNIDQQTLEAGAFELSRSIARHAATGGAPIVTIDAAGDPRFREALSVSDLHLRSVLAVPLQVKGRAVGTLYMDNRLRKGAFDEQDTQLVLDFAEQAGIAIENARLMSELRRRERQIEVLNRRLESELAVRKEELVGMKQELRENRDALAIRYDYRNIVGRTPRMLDLFRLLDRLTDTTLPVVIQGESGTGKELVARALHFNGPRRDRPFVSENCAAIPETLLESTLFGAVRGAYTGADHDSRGLFEVADGGTLFLDEVGEMSAAMQGKLLRVLQAGELRRVGSERTRKVDVRIIAATNRDLGRMVEEGRFRQDLFFRLSVAPIVLPPLRERRDDIPAIVEHVLTKMATATATATATTTKSAGGGRGDPPRDGQTGGRRGHGPPWHLSVAGKRARAGKRVDARRGALLGRYHRVRSVTACGRRRRDLLVRSTRSRQLGVASARGTVGTGPADGGPVSFGRQPDPSRRSAGTVAFRPAEEDAPLPDWLGKRGREVAERANHVGCLRGVRLLTPRNPACGARARVLL